MIELTRLRTFREVACRGSFTAAAAALGFSQPAISHQIAQLERELRTPLFERSARHIRLTPAGEALLGHVEAILARVADAEREVAEAARVGKRRLQVAAFPTAAVTVLPSAVAVFRREMPDVSLTVVEADPGDSLPALAAGEHDVALAYDYPVLANRPREGLDLEPLFVDPMCVVLPHDHPCAAMAEVPLVALASESWAAPHHSVCRDALELVCRGAGFTPEVMSETNDYLVMQGLVASGAGVAVIPRLAAAITQRPDLVVRPLAGHALERVTFIVTRAGTPATPALLALRAALLAVIPQVTAAGLPVEAFEAEGVRQDSVEA